MIDRPSRGCIRFPRPALEVPATHLGQREGPILGGPMIEIKLKRKYRYATKGRFAGGERPAPRKPKRHKLGPKSYNPRDHVMILVDGTRLHWAHYDEAREVLG